MKQCQVSCETINNFINRVVNMAPKRNMTLIGRLLGIERSIRMSLNYSLHDLILISQSPRHF